jgi:hypothetical protein
MAELDGQRGGIRRRREGEQKTNLIRFPGVAARQCRVSVNDVNGTRHTVTLHAATLFEAAAAAVGVFRQEPWAADALTPNAVLRVEVQPPPVVHDVPLKAVERWLNGPSSSPRERSAKRRVGEG